MANLYPWSPYQRSDATQVQIVGAQQSQTFLSIHKRVTPGELGLGSYVQYLTRANQRLDQIANEVMGRPELWWMIADLNWDQLYPNLFLVPGGIYLKVPTQQTANSV